MGEMKWAWVLFVAATLALLVRLVMWLGPWTQDVRDRRQTVEAPVAAEPVLSPDPPEPAKEPEPPIAEEEPAWPDEGPADVDWTPAQTILAEWMEEARAPQPEPPPEEFHFRRTRWGMTRADVLAAENGAPAREDGQRLLYVTTTLDLPCLLTYSFVQDRLMRAALAFSDPAGREIPPLSVAQAQRRFLYLRGQLRARYGEPVELTVPVERDVRHLRRRAEKQGELAAQYDRAIAEAEERLAAERDRLKRRYDGWRDPETYIARGLAPLERDLDDLRQWKADALAEAAESRRSIQERRAADRTEPLVGMMIARWPYARDLHDVELRLDLRPRLPRLGIRYQAARLPAGPDGMDEL